MRKRLWIWNLSQIHIVESHVANARCCLQIKMEHFKSLPKSETCEEKISHALAVKAHKIRFGAVHVKSKHAQKRGRLNIVFQNVRNILVNGFFLIPMSQFFGKIPIAVYIVGHVNYF